MLRGLLALTLLLTSSQALPDDGLTAQQERMRHCNGAADAKRLAGAQRNHFIVDCLKGDENGNGRKLTPQQQRSEDCSKVARERRMEGAERRGFLSACTRPPLQKRPRDCADRAREMKLEAEDRFRFINGCVEGTKTRT
ncbi:MAG TPA: PsiF family protein [Thermoanaerobaculia bacterium]|jgi:hypothetical protein|nr:PsiF family protein [Thermoanaerobaculia bacterium]